MRKFTNIEIILETTWREKLLRILLRGIYFEKKTYDLLVLRTATIKGNPCYVVVKCFVVPLMHKKINKLKNFYQRNKKCCFGAQMRQGKEK